VIVPPIAPRCTPNGHQLLVELAEALNAPVIDQAGRAEFAYHASSQPDRAAAPWSGRRMSDRLD